MLSEADKTVIGETLAPLLRSGEVSLLLGAGFSIGSPTDDGRIPGGEGLRDAILARCGKTAGARTTLKDAYVLGEREIEDFPGFLRDIFTVVRAEPWQQRLFAYAWKRIYTTNIDNVLDIAYGQQKRVGRLGGDFKFFNYTDPSSVSETIGSIPVASIHGTCSRLSDGFIFSGLEYGLATAKVMDWHRDLAARALTGNLLVVGNQLEESDLDAYIAARNLVYARNESTAIKNWIVLLSPDPIKAENYRAAGYYVIDSTAQEFFEYLFQAVEPRGIGDIVVEDIPLVRDAVKQVRALTWFKGSMSLVVEEIEQAREERRLLRHFVMGDEPDWVYIVQNAHAETSRINALTSQIGELVSQNSNGIGVLHVTGPSGAGKTTAVKAALRSVVGTYPAIYEFKSGAAIDPDLLKEVISKFTEKSIFVFYSAAEFYYAISYITDFFRGKRNHFCLFILEDRSRDFARNQPQLKRPDVSVVFKLGELELLDAAAIARKIDEHGLVFEGFSDLPIERRARRIVDAERGYSGDLLTTLFSLTTDQHFEAKIHEDYFGVRDDRARSILEAVAIVHSLGFHVPLQYVAGFLDLSLTAVQKLLSEDLAGVLIYSAKNGSVRCRHQIIANYYFDECIAKHGSSQLILQILRFLSRQFTVADIRHHPLPYRIYKEIVSYEFLFDRYFANENRLESTENVYHECQSLFGKDGIFWLHFGRFYRKTNRLDEAIECFRTGLSYFVSFQTRHQLGIALLERYVTDGCVDEGDYVEGIGVLEDERVARGAEDAFPVGTMLDWLRKIVEANPGNDDARDRLKACANFALRHFRDDTFVRAQLSKYFGREF